MLYASLTNCSACAISEHVGLGKMAKSLPEKERKGQSSKYSNMTNIFTRWTRDASNAMEDMYGTTVLGDDAGDADRIVVILQPPAFLVGRRSLRMWNALGLNFVNIQNRAYVQQVEEGSPADLQGVRRRDSIQYAAVLAEEWQNPLTDDFEDISKQALERESTGLRISYNDLKRILEQRGGGGMDSTFLSPAAGVSVPTTISVDRTSSTAKTRRQQQQDLGTPRPLVLVLRRTRKRRSSNNNHSWSLNIWPHFRLDEECDVATKIIHSLATSSTSEASSIRQKMQTCTGIAFLRSNKFTMGLSVQGGSGIVLSKLPDGSWSPPSAIGTWGMGVGLQLGVEVAHTLIILQTPEALEHFLRGASFQMGVGIGAAIANYGREAVGAASVSGALCGSTHILDFSKEDEYDVDHTDATATAAELNNNKLINGVTPMMAYATSEGLYVGVSLEGNKLFTRHDINGRVYQFYKNSPLNNNSHNNHSHNNNHNNAFAPTTSANSEVTPQEILQGKVPVPSEAHTLIASLVAAEFQHDVQTLPPLPTTNYKKWESSTPQKTLDQEEVHWIQDFQDFLLGGVAVTQLPSTKTKRGDLARTLWLWLPGPGMSWELGFISKHSERTRESNSSNGSNGNIYSRSANHVSDNMSTTSEDLTLDSALMVSSGQYPYTSIHVFIHYSSHTITFISFCLG